MKLELDPEDDEDEKEDDEEPEPKKLKVLVCGLSGVFIAVFVMLKLTGVITISWWWILLCILCE